MIKSTKINYITVKPFWNTGNGKHKPVKPAHAEISDEPYLNVILFGRKKSGKTTAGLYMLKHFMTNKTKLIIFSPDLENDKDNSKALDLIKDKFGDEAVTIYDRFKDRDGNNLFLQEVDDAGERFDLDN